MNTKVFVLQGYNGFSQKLTEISIHENLKDAICAYELQDKEKQTSIRIVLRQEIELLDK